MSKISRKTQKIFGSTAGGSDIAKFGSLAAGSPAFSTDPAVIQSLANYLTGWLGAVIGNNSPEIEDMNAVCYLYAYQLAYILQDGVPEWDSGTTYYKGSIVNGNGGLLYVSLTDTNLGNALSSATNWALINPPFYNVRVYGAVGDGVTDDSTAINAAISAAVSASGGTVYFPKGIYFCASDLTVTGDNITLTGMYGASKISLKVTSTTATNITVPTGGTGNFSMTNLWVDGSDYTQGATIANSGYLVKVYGASAAAYISKVLIQNCIFTNASEFAVYLEYVRDFNISNNIIKTIYYTGIEIRSGLEFEVRGNTVEDILGNISGNSYGLSCTESLILSTTANCGSGATTLTSLASTTGLVIGDEVDGPSIAADTQIKGISGTTVTLTKTTTASSSGGTFYFYGPITQRGIVDGNAFNNNPNWEMIDTHSGKNLVFSNNVITDSISGIGIGSSGANMRRAPKRITVEGNVIRGYNSEDTGMTVTGTGTAMTLVTNPNFTISVGDYCIIQSTSQAKRITAVASQISFTVASGFTADPSSAACTISQRGKNNFGITCVGVDGSTTPSNVFDYVESCIIKGNVVQGYGYEENSLGTSIYVYNTLGCIIEGNDIIEPNHIGILPYYANYGLQIRNNYCIDPWSYTHGACCFVEFGNDYQYIVAGGNQLRTGSKTALHTYDRGWFWSGVSHADFVDNGGNSYDLNDSSWHASAPSFLCLNPNCSNQPYSSTAIPSGLAGKTWNVGDVVWKRTPTSATTAGWICSVTGNPGTWLAMANLA